LLPGHLHLALAEETVDRHSATGEQNDDNDDNDRCQASAAQASSPAVCKERAVGVSHSCGCVKDQSAYHHPRGCPCCATTGACLCGYRRDSPPAESLVRVGLAHGARLATDPG